MAHRILEYAAEEVEVVVDRLPGTAGRNLMRDVRLKLDRADASQRAVAEERHQVNPEARLIVLDRRWASANGLEVRKVRRADSP
jgi:hypothetical protein